MTIVMLMTFFLLMVIGTPLFAAMLAVALVGFAWIGDLNLFRLMVQQFFGGLDSFSLMAIPLFVFAGSLMNVSGLTDRLLKITGALVGHLRGGLGYVNVLASILFAGINGSAAADTSALGSVLIPAMEKEGYSKPYAAGLTAGSSLIGPIIPPSIFMILYANMTNTSIGGLFIAGIVPGLILGIAFMVMNYWYSVYHKFPKRDHRANWAEIAVATWQALPALIAPFVIIGGIVFGVFTPTESGAIAVAYIIVVGVLLTRKLTKRALWKATKEAARLTSAIFMIIGAAAIIGWLLSYARVPEQFSRLVIGTTNNPLVVMAILSAIIFVTGMFMEEVATLVLLTPIFTPLALAAGIDPLHFGIVMTLNITIALITPPMGACVYIASAVGKVDLGDLFKSIWPFVGVAVFALIIIALFPPLTTFLPSVFGL
jgi:TRAP-type transport system large permease protein